MSKSRGKGRLSSLSVVTPPVGLDHNAVLRHWGRHVERALKERRARHQEDREGVKDTSDVLVEIVSPGALASLDRLDHTAALLQAAEQLVESLENRMKLDRKLVMQAVKESVDIAPDGDWSINIPRRVVLDEARSVTPDSTNDSDSEGKLTLLTLVDSLLDFDDEALDGVREGVFPDCWAQVLRSNGNETFITAVAELFLTLGDQSRDVFRGIAKLPRIAKRVVRDADAPQVLSRYAKLVLCEED